MEENVSKAAPVAGQRGMFIAAGEQGLRMSSSDGVNWKNIQSGKEGEIYRAACFGNGRVVAVGTYGGNSIFAVSSDGEKWQISSKDGKYKLSVRGVGFGDGKFLAIGG